MAKTATIKAIKKRQPYYRVEKFAESDSASIFLYGYIGDKDWWDDSYDYTDEKIVKDIKDLCKSYSEVNIRINSSGGSTKHGAAIVTAIREHSDKIHTWNDGVAYSMASEILFAAKKENIHIADNSMTMVHVASGWSFGNAKEMRVYADYLDKLTGVNAKYLSKRFGMDEQDFIDKFYDYEDHFLDADDLKEYGFTIEGYEVEGLPDSVDAKDYSAVRAYFNAQEMQEGQPTNKGLFEKISNYFTNKNQGSKPESHKNELDMSKVDDVKKAIDNGDVSVEDLQALIEEKKANTPITKGDVSKIIDKKFDELKTLLEEKEEAPETPEEPTEVEETDEQKEMKALKERIAELEKMDGGVPTPPGGVQEGDEEKEVSEFHKADNPLNKMARKDLGL